VPFRTVLSINTFGLAWYRSLSDFINASCSSDLSTCTAYDDPALVFSNTVPGCVSNNTCVVYPKQCNYAFITIYDGSSSRKNGFNVKWNAFFKSNSFGVLDLVGPTVDGILMDVSLFAPGPGYLYSNQMERPGTYFPLSDFYLHKVIETSNGLLRSYIGSISTAFYSVELRHCTASDWLVGFFQVLFFAESSPLAIIPLNYNKDYLRYQELRQVFSYSQNGVDQFGWNVQDMIKVLKDIYQDRAWAVFDDRQNILYLYNLNPDYIPDWLVERLAPVAMKVLKAPSDASVARYWLDELNRRNGYNQTPVKTV